MGLYGVSATKTSEGKFLRDFEFFYFVVSIWIHFYTKKKRETMEQESLIILILFSLQPNLRSEQYFWGVGEEKAASNVGGICTCVQGF